MSPYSVRAADSVRSQTRVWFRLFPGFPARELLLLIVLTGLRDVRLALVRGNSIFLIEHAIRAFVRGDFAAGGDEEDRTPDPLLAGQVLSQLSYTPIWVPLSL